MKCVLKLSWRFALAVSVFFSVLAVTQAAAQSTAGSLAETKARLRDTRPAGFTNKPIELMVAYPDAKVLLTLHPAGPDAWYQSTMETIYFTEISWQFRVLELVVPTARKMGEMGRTLIWGRSHQGTMHDRAKAIALYKQHIEDVKAAVPADRLLIFSAKDGWKPLCEFLGVPIPDAPFPNVNDRADFKKRLVMMRAAAYTVIGLGVAACAGLAYGGLKLLY